MTALGRHATVDWVREAGYSFDTIDDLSDAPVGNVVAAQSQPQPLPLPPAQSTSEASGTQPWSLG